MRWRRVAVVGVFGFLAAACVSPPHAPTTPVGADAEVDARRGTADPGGEAEPWWLVGATPDGRHVELTSTGGGCSHFQGWVTDADQRRVTVEARWEHTGADGCDAVLLSETVVLDLGEPLGDRALVGCGHDDCLAPPNHWDAPRAFPGQVHVLDGNPVVAGQQEVWGFTPGGEAAWRTPPADGWAQRAGDLLLRFEHDRHLEARDAAGDLLWEGDGVTVAGLVGETIVVCPREQAGEVGEREQFLGGLDRRTGEWRWRLDGEPCTTAGVTGATAAAGDEQFARVEFDGEGTWLDVRDTTTGERLHRVRITDPEAAIGTPTWLGDGRVAVSSFEGERWIVDLVSGQVEPAEAAAGRIEAVVGDVPIVIGDTLVQGLLADASEVRWEVPRAGNGAELVVFDEVLLRVGGPHGSVVFVDPRTGEDRWAADLGPGVQHVGASAADGHLYVATSRALFAFDASSGEQRWWAPLTPHDVEPVGGVVPAREAR